MIKTAMDITSCKVVIYFNSDILFSLKTSYIIDTIKEVYKRNEEKQMLLIGKRCDMYWKDIYKYKNHKVMWKKCKLHSGYGIDYFIFTIKTFCIKDIEILNKIIVGRIRYDNIILSLAMQKNRSIIVDVTDVVKAIHLSISIKEKSNLTKVSYIQDFLYIVPNK